MVLDFGTRNCGVAPILNLCIAEYSVVRRGG